MNNDIERRIVQMQFDNAQFESKIKDTMRTLESLDQVLRITGTSTPGLDELGNNAPKAAKRIGLIGEAVQQVAIQFNVLKVAGTAAITRLTNEAMNLGSRITNALWSPLIEGGKRRSLNIQNAKFMLKGLGIAWEEIESQISYGVNDTAYGLDAAAKVAASLAASNVELGDNMATTLRAISGVAAMTNDTYESIGDIFTTVASNGKLMTMQLRQLSAKGLNVTAQLIKNVEELKGKTEAEVNEMVTNGMISFDMFSKAMYDAFGEHAVEANDTFAGSLSNVKSALAKIGKEFADPVYAQAINIFNALRVSINTIKKMMGTNEAGQGLGIYQTWAKIVENVGAVVTKMLEQKELMAIVLQLMNNMHQVILAISQAFVTVFDAPDFQKIFASIYQFLRDFQMNEEGMTIMRNLFIDIFGIIKNIAVVGGDIIKIIAPFIPQAAEILGIIVNIIHNILTMLNDVSTPLGAAFQELKQIIALNIGGVLKAISDSMKKVDWVKFADAVGFVLQVMIKLTAKTLQFMSIGINGIGYLLTHFEALKSVLAAILVTAVAFISKAAVPLASLFSGAKSLVLNFATNGMQNIPILGRLSSAMDALLGKNRALTASNNEVADSYTNVSNSSRKPAAQTKSATRPNDKNDIDEATKSVVKSLDDSGNKIAVSASNNQIVIKKSIGGFFEQMAAAIGFKNNIVREIVTKVTKAIQNAYAVLTSGFLGMASTLENVFSSFKISNIFLVLAALIAPVLINVSSILFATGKLFNNLADSLAPETFTDKVYALADCIKDFAIGISILMGAFLIFVNLININKFQQVMTVMTACMAAIGQIAVHILGLVVIIKLLSSVIAVFNGFGTGYAREMRKAEEAKKQASLYNALPKIILSVAASIVAVVAAFKVLSQVPAEDIEKGLHLLLGIMAMIGLLTAILLVLNAILGGATVSEATIKSEQFNPIYAFLKKTGLVNTAESKNKKVNPVGGVVQVLLSTIAAIWTVIGATLLLAAIPDAWFTKGSIRLLEIMGGLTLFVGILSLFARMLGKRSTRREWRESRSKGLSDGTGDALVGVAKLLTTVISSVWSVIIAILALNKIPDTIFENGGKKLALILTGISVVIFVLSLATRVMKSPEESVEKPMSGLINLIKSLTKMMTFMSLALLVLNKSGVDLNDVWKFVVPVFAGLTVLIGVIFLTMAHFVKSLPKDSDSAKDIMNNTTKIIKTLLDSITLITGLIVALVAVLSISDIRGNSVDVIQSALSALNWTIGIILVGLIGLIVAISHLYKVFTQYDFNKRKYVTKNRMAVTDSVLGIIKALATTVGLIVTALAVLVGVLAFADISNKKLSAISSILTNINWTLVIVLGGVALITVLISRFYRTMTSVNATENRQKLFNQFISILKTVTYGIGAIVAMLAIMVASVSLSKNTSIFKTVHMVLSSTTIIIGAVLAFAYFMTNKVGNLPTNLKPVTFQLLAIFGSITLIIGAIGMVVKSLSGVTLNADSISSLFTSITILVGGLAAIAAFIALDVLPTASLNMGMIALMFASIGLLVFSLSGLISELGKINPSQVESAISIVDKCVELLLAISVIATVVGIINMGTGGAFTVFALIAEGVLALAGVSAALVISMIAVSISTLAVSIQNLVKATPENILNNIAKMFDPVYMGQVADAIEKVAGSIAFVTLALTTLVGVAGALSATPLGLAGVLGTLFILFAGINVLVANINSLLDNIPSIIDGAFGDELKHRIDECFEDVVSALNASVLGLSFVFGSNGEHLTDWATSALGLTEALNSSINPMNNLADALNNFVVPNLESTSNSIAAATGSYVQGHFANVSYAPSAKAISGLVNVGPQKDFWSWASDVEEGVDEWWNNTAAPAISRAWNGASIRMVDGMTNIPGLNWLVDGFANLAGFKSGKDIVRAGYAAEAAYSGGSSWDDASQTISDSQTSIARIIDSLGSLLSGDFNTDWITGVITKAFGWLGLDEGALGGFREMLSNIGGGDFMSIFGVFGDSSLNNVKNTNAVAEQNLDRFATHNSDGTWTFGKTETDYTTGRYGQTYYVDNYGNRVYYNDKDEHGAYGEAVRNYNRYLAMLQDESTAYGDFGGQSGVGNIMDMITNWIPDMSDMFDPTGSSGLGTSAGLADSIASTSGLGSGIGDKSGSINQINSNNTFTFTQNNYSPEALSRTDLYKQTRAQLQDWTGFMRAQPTY